jgi:hypothetical protein
MTTKTDQPEADSLDQRLEDGARWARFEGKERLASLLEEVRDEMTVLRQQNAQQLALGNRDADDIGPELDDLQTRIRALEVRFADLER